MPAQALHCGRGLPHKYSAFRNTRHSCLHIHVQNMFHSLVCSWTVQLAQGTPLMLGYLCDNIGLVLACLPSGNTDVTASHSHYDPAIQDLYLVSCTFYVRWRSLYIFPFLNGTSVGKHTHVHTIHVQVYTNSTPTCTCIQTLYVMHDIIHVHVMYMYMYMYMCCLTIIIVAQWIKH